MPDLKNKFTSEGINEEWFDYATTHSEVIPQLLLNLEKETHQKILQPRMMSGRLQGRLLSLLSHMARPECILEVGTFTGYATLCLAEGLKDKGIIHTIDCNEELIGIQKRYFKQSPYAEKIKQHHGFALEILPQLIQSQRLY